MAIISKLRKIGSALLPLTPPLVMEGYIRIARNIPFSGGAFFESLAVSLIFATFVMTLRGSRSLLFRTFCGLVLALVFSFACLFNVAYYDAFRSWILPGQMGEFDAALPLFVHVIRNMNALDGVFIFVVPIILLSISLRKHKPVYVKGVCGAATVGIVVVFTSAAFGGASRNNPINGAAGARFIVDPIELAWNSLGRTSETPFANETIRRHFRASGDNVARQDKSFPLYSPSRDTVIAQRRNVIVVLVESYRAYESGLYGAKKSLTPFLDSLGQHGLVIKNFYASGTQTARGELAVLASMHPNFSRPPYYVERPETKMSSMPGVFRQLGYKSFWVSGYTAEYSRKREFYLTHGFDSIVDDKAYAVGTPKVGLGVSDEAIFTKATSIFDKQEGPFFAEIMTLSSHFPFKWQYPVTLPDSLKSPGGPEDYNAYRNGMYYSDFALGQFFRSNRNKEWFKNALIVVLADHGYMLYSSEDSKENSIWQLESFFRVPCVFFGADITPGILDTIGSQVDVAPTIFDILGIRADHSFIGQSMLSPPNRHRYALCQMGNAIHVRYGNTFQFSGVVELPDGRNETYCEEIKEGKCLELHINGDLLQRVGKYSIDNVDKRGTLLFEHAFPALMMTRQLAVSDSLFPYSYK